MKTLRELLEKKKDDFNDIYYCPKSNEIFLVESVYILLPKKTEWVRYADKNLWGKDRPVKFCSTWVYIGKIK